MEPWLICLIVFVVMVALIMIGVPIAISMFICAIWGFIWIADINMALTQFTTGIFTSAASYTFAVVPLFTIVGSLAGETGIAAGTFAAAKKWLGRMRGGLLYAVGGANMIFGACSGISAAGNIVFSKIALPELDKASYDRRLSLGTITAAGTLSVLIPPSIPIITFCLLTNVSVGSALMCGISTGILFAVCMFIIIKIISVVRPGKIPVTQTEKIPLKEKLKTLKLLLPIGGLFALIVGGSFAGWFPATVGGAVACVAIYIYAFAIKMPFKKIWAATWDGVQSFTGIYLLIIGGKLFSRFVAMTGLADTLVDAIAKAHIPAFGVFCLVLLLYIFCGCFMDLMSIIIITVPVVFPLLNSLGYHELLLVILLVFSMEMANLTPPIGMAVFHVSNAVKVPTSEVFRGVIPYFLMDLILVLVCVNVPMLVLWLPKLLGYTI